MKQWIPGFKFGSPPLFVLVISMFLVGCQTAGDGSEGPKTSGETRSAQSEQAVQPLPSRSGPKLTVAVGKFSSIGSFSNQYGDWDIGGGLAAMLTTGLLSSDHFVVVERAALDQILNEQDLKAEGLVNPETGPKLHQLAGVQLLVYGAVTEFGTRDEGGGFNFGLFGSKGGGSPFDFGGGQKSTKGKVAMDIRVVDTTTGEILESHTVSREIKSSGFALSTKYEGMSLGGDKFKKTPLGEATRSAIDDAVRAIATTAKEQPWTGHVVTVEDGEIYINAGSQAGVRRGDTFMVERIVKTFTDPATGQVLGTKRKELGVIRIFEVRKRLASGSFAPLGNDAVKRGDLVVSMNK